MRKWWRALFPPSTAEPWSEVSKQRQVCKETLETGSGQHRCYERGPHYNHTCFDETCGFRWVN